MATTQYAGVFQDAKGQYFYEASLGIDRMTGKRIKKKSRKSQNGKKFSSAKEAYKELTRVRNEFFQANGYSNYNMTFKQFMDDVYLPFYETDVLEQTFQSRKPMLKIIEDRFGKKQLRDITVQDVQYYRTWLLSKRGANYSNGYASLAFSTLKKILEMAVNLQYLEINVARRVKAIPKGKADVEYWTKKQFEKVISQIFIDDFYEHLSFVMLWLYFNTGIRVNEGTALFWDDVNFEKKQLRVTHMLLLESKTKWKRQTYTKTEAGSRIISLDDDTITILKAWKERQAKIGDVDFIFSYDGNPMIKSTISRIIKRYSKLAGVPGIEAKGLRHSHASYLINEFNVSVLILSKRLGHSSPEITLKHYSHMWGGVDREIAEVMNGNITIQTAGESSVSFNGNQAIKK
ncbi:MAG: tyrosine-type recombinase/integrase [Lactobacillaceae bacterium]|jgi:integrase|nr:tyrosine-type recombinase/integrase [Lactobacillaceae bacterium]